MEINASIKIKSIKRIKLEKPIDVYDLHVKKNHNFPIGKSGICVHNCTQYLHGEQSLGGVICGLAQDFVGTNNITLMIPDGTFGSRLKPAPSATRYIFTYKAPVFNQIFNKDDIPLLTEQVFEGDVIEPRFFVPTLPLILINGSEGIGSGWSQKILPRDSKEVTKHIRNYLKNGKLPQRIAPYYKGFNGVIEYEAEKNRWLIKGDFEKVNRTTLRITELPIGYDLDKYVKVLTELEEKKVIRDFDDLSNPGNSKFEFIVKVTSEFIDRDKEIVLNDLKLIKRVTENFTCLDENNMVREFKSDIEILEDYCKIRLRYYQLRKDSILDKLTNQITVAQAKYQFIGDVLDKAIILERRRKDEIITQIQARGYDEVEGSYAYLINMPLHSLSEDTMSELKKKWLEHSEEYKVVADTSPGQFWEDDLKEIK